MENRWEEKYYIHWEEKYYIHQVAITPQTRIEDIVRFNGMNVMYEDPATESWSGVLFEEGQTELIFEITGDPDHGDQLFDCVEYFNFIEDDIGEVETYPFRHPNPESVKPHILYIFGE